MADRWDLIRVSLARRFYLATVAQAAVVVVAAVLLGLVFGRQAAGEKLRLPWAFLISSVLLAVGSWYMEQARFYVRREKQVEFRWALLKALISAMVFVSVQGYGLWAIDKGSDMVVRFNPQGRVNLVFGRKKEASDEAEPWTRVNPPRPAIDGQFRQPTDVTWDPQGNIYISDGYINARVAKYDANGDWVKSFGTPGNGPGQLNTPHSIASDVKGNIYVADRGNRRIQVFNGNGDLQKIITIDVPIPADAKPWFGNQPTAEAAKGQSGQPWAVCITPPNAAGNQFLYASDAFPGRIYKLSLDGKVLGMLGKSGRQPKQFGWIHEMACPSENELYVAEILNWRVQKLTLKPGR